MNLDFDSILNKALAEWPSNVDASILENSNEDFSRYDIKDFEDIFDTIDARCIGVDSEVLWRDLHRAIYEVIHEAAKFVEKIEIQSLRRDVIRLLFERNLKASASCKYDLRWSPDDYLLVESYFSKNRSLGSQGSDVTSY